MYNIIIAISLCICVAYFQNGGTGSDVASVIQDNKVSISPGGLTSYSVFNPYAAGG